MASTVLRDLLGLLPSSAESLLVATFLEGHAGPEWLCIPAEKGFQVWAINMCPS